MMFGLDFNVDGIVDHWEPIGATRWREVKTFVVAPTNYHGIRFVLQKRGAGRAVMAQIRAQSKASCPGEPLALRDRALGVTCGSNSECASGVCCDLVCSECCKAAADGGGAPSDPGATLTSCPAAQSCERRGALVVGWLGSGTGEPRQCDPGKRTHAPGAPCMADDDCASGACEDNASSPARADGPDGGLVPCEGEYPDAGKECGFVMVRGGRCR